MATTNPPIPPIEPPDQTLTPDERRERVKKRYFDMAQGREAFMLAKHHYQTLQHADGVNRLTARAYKSTPPKSLLEGEDMGVKVGDTYEYHYHYETTNPEADAGKKIDPTENSMMSQVAPSIPESKSWKALKAASVVAAMLGSGGLGAGATAIIMNYLSPSPPVVNQPAPPAPGYQLEGGGLEVQLENMGPLPE